MNDTEQIFERLRSGTVPERGGRVQGGNTGMVA